MSTDLPSYLTTCPSEAARLHDMVDGKDHFYKKDGVVTLREVDAAIEEQKPILAKLEAQMKQLGGGTPSEVHDQSVRGKQLTFKEATDGMKLILEFLGTIRQRVVANGPYRYFKGCSINPHINEPTPGVCEGLSDISWRFVDCNDEQAFHIHRLVDSGRNYEQYKNFADYLKKSKGDYRGQVQVLSQGGSYVEISFPTKGKYKPTMALTAKELNVILDYPELTAEYFRDRNRYSQLFKSRKVIQQTDGSFQINGHPATALEVWGLVQTGKFMKDFETASLPGATAEKREEFQRALEEKGLIPYYQDWHECLNGFVKLYAFDTKDGRFKSYGFAIPELVQARHFASAPAVTFDLYLDWIKDPAKLKRYQESSEWPPYNVQEMMGLEKGYTWRQQKIDNPEN